MFRIVISFICIVGSGLIGFWIARTPAPTPEHDPITSAPVPGDANAAPSLSKAYPVDSPSREPPTPTVENPAGTGKRLEALRAELEAQDSLLAEYQERIHGTTLDWPEDTPEIHAPEQFQSRLSQVLDDCALPAQLSGFDCHEPPCLAVLRLYDPEPFRTKYKQCPEWNERMGHSYSMKNILVPCGDGRTETVAILHMVWDGLSKSQGENLHKRISRRREIVESGWKCQKP